jgi:2-succinyl-5-enolpyruvyl-6-hydroxy-3-cyclohexene-1-carboxylate synthase
VWEYLNARLESAENALSEAVVARDVAASVCSDELLVVSNSLPIRDLDWFCPGKSTAAAVLSQRGAAGIDGIVSGALGAAAAWSNGATLLVGDSAFLHDISALATASKAGTKLMIVAVNNNGGRIFEHLPIGKAVGYSAILDPYFVLPHGLKIAEIASAFGISSTRVNTRRELLSALKDFASMKCVTVIEAMIDPDTSARHYAFLDEASQFAAETLNAKD